MWRAGGGGGGDITYKDIYSPVALKCTQEFVLVAFHSYRALTNKQNITISHVLKL